MVNQVAEQFQVAVIGQDRDLAVRVEAVLADAGYRAHRLAMDLEGLRRAAEIKPHAVVLLEYGEPEVDWILNLVEDNPGAPMVLAITQPSSLDKAPPWLFDIVEEPALEWTLPHRLGRALRYADMRALSEQQGEKLGLTKAQIGMLSMMDPVTGLFNRRYFAKHLAESFAAATRYSRPLTLLLVRLDNLDDLAINLGPELANDVVDSVANALVSVIRRADTIARIDEDLFGFLLPETSQDGGGWLVPRLLGRLERTVFPYDAKILVSTAVCQLSASHESAESFLGDGFNKLPRRS